MSVEMEIKIQGDRELISRLQKLGNSLNDMSQPFKTAGNVLVKFYSSVPFSSRGSVYGREWPPLSDHYAKWKAKKWGGGRPVLISSGTMAKSFEYESSSSLLRIYNTTDYFRKHQLGEGVPQRVVMLFDQQRQKFVLDPVVSYVKKLVENG